ncbi:DUF433 domain-containing protein [Candidatus Woesearchaeota archaeon]|nr:DUF433 domain-containing protein [Candidatus Woesearchaeota archaeon]
MKSKIVIDPKILVGKPVIAGTRIPVYLVLNLLAHGKTIQEITEDYPGFNYGNGKSSCFYYGCWRHYIARSNNS